jgi:uroporphyrinogen decarboxylase
MDSRERVLTALRGGEPDRVPCALGFFGQSLYGVRDADEHFHTDVRFVDFAPPAGQDSFIEYLESLPTGVHVGSRAQLRTYLEWGYHPEVPAGRYGAGGDRDAAAASSAAGSGLGAVAARVSGLLPRVIDRRRHAHLEAEVERLHARGLAVAGSPPHLGGELFESAWRLRGFELFMKDLVKRPDLVGYLLDQLTTMAAESARILAGAGVDVLILDDDVAYNRGLLISPAMWRRFFKPRLAAIIVAARAPAASGPSGPLVLYHSDGDFTAILDELVEIGIDAVNPIASDCMDAVAIRRRFGERLTLWGTVGTAWTWDHGSAGQMREEVRTRIAALGRAGLLLCPAYDLDFAPRSNVAAFVEAVPEFG